MVFISKNYRSLLHIGRDYRCLHTGVTTIDELKKQAAGTEGVYGAVWGKSNDIAYRCPTCEQVRREGEKMGYVRNYNNYAYKPAYYTNP